MCWPTMTLVMAETPKEMGTMTAATPRANTKGIDTSARRRWKLVAKYAGSITEMQ